MLQNLLRINKFSNTHDPNLFSYSWKQCTNELINEAAESLAACALHPDVVRNYTSGLCHSRQGGLIHIWGGSTHRVDWLTVGPYGVLCPLQSCGFVSEAVNKKINTQILSWIELHPLGYCPSVTWDQQVCNAPTSRAVHAISLYRLSSSLLVSHFHCWCWFVMGLWLE